MHFVNRTSIPWEPYLGTTGLPSYVMGALARQDADGRIACGPGLTMADGLTEDAHREYPQSEIQ
jgi:hypothetical protein